MAKTVLYILGAVLVIVGVLGFISDPVLGIFEVNTLQNLVHLVTGLALLWGGYTGGSQARTIAIVLGVVYALIAVLGLVLPGDTILGILESNLSSNIFYVILAVILLYVGFTTPKEGAMAAPMPSASPSPEMPQQGGGNAPQQ